MDAANDPTVQSTVLMWASQLGKTEVENNVIGFYIEADPSPVLMVQPTLEMAESWSKTRLGPMLRDCPCFEGKVKEARTRDSGNTILSKMYFGGDIAIAGANSASGLAARPRRVVLMDEIDRFPPSAGTEGDPCLLAEKRTESFWNAVIYKSSSPTVRGASRVEKEFEQTDKRMWFCPCPRCGQHQTLKWRQVLWGKRLIDHLVEYKIEQPAHEPPTDGSDAIYACEHCHANLSDADRVKMVLAGEWRPTAPFNGKRGYFLNGINSPFKAKKGFKNRLHQMAAQFLEAKAGGRQTLKAWTNTFLAETWEEEGSRPLETRPLTQRAERYAHDALPEGVIIAIAAVDVQERWLQVEVQGLGMDDETWGIEAATIEGNPDQTEVWDDLADVLGKSYKRSDGVEVKIHATAIDMRHKGDRVRNFIRQSGLPRVYPVYGVTTGQTLLVTPRRPDRHGLRAYAVDSKAGKDIIFARLKLEVPGPRFMHFPSGNGYNEEYFAQLTAEVSKPRYNHGFVTYYYEKIRDRNEALDIRVYLLACVEILKPNLTTIAKRLKAPGEQPGAAQRPPTNPQSPRPRQRIRVGVMGMMGWR
jgi:phage terminase large subunit GpA-like protein